jgi:Ca-activated chloride channel homolog
MTDDLDDLKRMMDAATPRPDAARRAENIALAEKNFADLQGSRDEARLMSAAPKRGLWTGVRQMLTSLTSRGALTASTAIVAVGLVMLTPFGGSVLDNVRSRGTPDEQVGMKRLAPEEPVVIAEEPMAADDTAESAPVAASAPRARDLAKVDVYEGDAAAPPPPSVVAPAPQAEMAPAMGITAGRAVGDIVVQPQLPDTEAFANADANPVKVVSEDPVSTFSIDVDTASYAVVRNSLTNGTLPPADAVRVEEMVNYFPYDYPAPEGDAAFLPTVQVTATPWNPDTRLVQIGIQGALPAVEDRPPLNLVFLIDTSGSMEDPAKLPLLKQSFRLMLGQLRPEDQVAIVTYAGSAGRVLDPTPAGERSTILAALDALGAGGSTAGQAGLKQAYATAAEMAQEGEVSRVILATDGDFNVGLSDPEALKDYIAAQRDSGTYLSVLGFGRGNLDDATMQALAQNGNGQAAYIDTLGEAQKVLVDQLGGSLFPIADDVKIQVEFNPGQVAEYRLIGYETRALRREDFNNDKVDAGDIGAGHQVTALYEVTPVGSPAQLNDPLRYGAATGAAAPDDSGELGFLRLRYKAPGEDASRLIETPITATSGNAEAGFAAAMAGFGQLLRGSVYLGDWSWEEAIALANETKGEDPFGYRAEAVQLMRLAQSLSAN